MNEPVDLPASSISVGDELLAGESLDTHGRTISTALAARGRRVISHRVVGDDVARIQTAIRTAMTESSLVIVTGGLGPTLDDVTREALAAAVDEPLVEDAVAVRAVEAWFAGRDRPMPPTNRRQALRPDSARCLENPNGTAPGVLWERDGVIVVLLPGPPRELHPMLDRTLRQILPSARPRPTIVVRAHGIGESDAAAKIQSLMDRGVELPVATTVSDSILAARIRGRDEDDAAMVSRLAHDVEQAWGPYVFGRDEDSLESALGRDLLAGNATIATAESCTGGGLGAAITAVSGSSAWYLGGYSTYSNRRKMEDLGVPADRFERDGAVSEAVAIAMAGGARERTAASISVSTTGIAGPGGGSSEKPVGTVWIGIADSSGAVARRFRFPGDRGVVRRRTVLAAMQMVRFRLHGIEAPLLWEETGDRPGTGR